MLAIERRKLILEQLHREKRVVVSELSRKFSVSEETIRRDLDKFEKDDLVTKSYGGAVLKEDVGAEMPFKDRKKRNMLGKRVIGDILSEIIRDGDHILLDPSLRRCGRRGKRISRSLPTPWRCWWSARRTATGK